MRVGHYAGVNISVLRDTGEKTAEPGVVNPLDIFVFLSICCSYNSPTSFTAASVTDGVDSILQRVLTQRDTRSASSYPFSLFNLVLGFCWFYSNVTVGVTFSSLYVVILDLCGVQCVLLYNNKQLFLSQATR